MRKILPNNLNFSNITNIRGPEERESVPDILSRTKHVYTVWDEKLGRHWFLIDADPPTRQRRTFYVESDAQDTLDPKAFWSAMEEALCQGYFSIHLSRGSWKPCELVNRFRGPNLLISKPVVNDSMLQFVRKLIDDRGLELVKMDGALYVHKFAVLSDLLMILQCEVESYRRLEQSPFTLQISHAVRHAESNAIRGFLLPFTGRSLASDEWRWSIEDKESLMLDLLDAVHDFEVRGAVHTDLKGANVLLTPNGMKLIDLDFLGSTVPWRSPFDDGSCAAAVHTFGKTVWELFTEQVPRDTTFTLTEAEIEGGVPQYVVDLVRDCCVDHKYKCIKQLFDATEQVLDPVRARRIPPAQLFASHQEGWN